MRRRGPARRLLRVLTLAAGAVAEELLGPQRRGPMPASAPIVREDDTEKRARTLKRLQVAPGPLAFVDACDLHAAEVAFGEDALDGMSFERIERRTPSPPKRWRPGDPPLTTERAPPSDLVPSSARSGKMWPGFVRSSGRVAGSTRVLMVMARS